MIRCTKCGETKSTNEFYYNRSRERYNSWCKQCVSEYRRGAGRRNTTTTASRREVNADQQTVGLEIEFVGATMQDVARALEVATGQDHVPVLGYHGNTCNCCGRRFNSAHWRVMHDGSVSHGNVGGEVVSPILAFPRDAAMLKAVLDAMRNVGARVNTSTGLHVHHGVRGIFTEVDHFRTMVRNFIGTQSTMNHLVAASRRDNGYCKPLDAGQAERYMTRWSSLASVGAIGDRYRTLNLDPFNRIGTVEFRQHQGTLNFSKIMAWVELGQAMVRAAAAGVVFDGGAMLDTLRDRAGLRADAREYLVARSEVLRGARDDEDMPVLARAA